MFSTWSATEVAFLLVAVIQTVAMILWAIVAKAVPGARPAAAHWSGYAALSAFTWASLAMELRSPPWISVLAGVLASLTLQRGIWVFIKRAPTYRLSIALVLAIVLVNTVEVPQRVAAGVNFSVLAWLFLAMAGDMYRHARAELRMRVPILLALPVLFGSLGFASRAVRAIVSPESVASEMARDSALNIETALGYVVLVLALHATLMALVIGRLVRELADLSRYDVLTGLLNRRAMQDELDSQLQRSRRSSEPFAVLMIDVDRFKSINDRYGHAVGDSALKGVAALLRVDLREVDRVGRFGGEEFVVLLPGSKLEQAQGVAERLRDAVGRDDLASVVPPIRLSISIGVAEWIAEDVDASGLLMRADAALYLAKRSGRDRVVIADPTVAVVSPR
jgi:diguanylate cyclase (GGDEF)-like protein